MSQQTQRMYYSQEAEEKARRQRTGLALAMLAIGVSLGSLVVLFFAPRSGDEMRQAFSEMAENAYSDGREATEQAIEGLQKDLDRLRKDIDERLKTVQN